MTFNRASPLGGLDRSIVLVGMMGAGKTAIGKRLAAKLELPFFDADHEIERAAGISISEIFARHGEAHFRAGEKRVISRLLAEGPIVLATGGGAYLDPDTRALIRNCAISVWLRCPLPVLLARVRHRPHRPLLNAGDPAEILYRLSLERDPIYAEADVVVDGSQAPPEFTMQNVLKAVQAFVPPARVTVDLPGRSYEVVIGSGLLARAGALIVPVLRQKRCVVISDETVAALYAGTLKQSFDEVGIAHTSIVIPPGEGSKSISGWASIAETLLDQKIDRHTTIIALGGGIVGDLAGFAAATVLRGLPFVQIPTTLLAQVDSSVGGKTGINTRHGKNLIGAFHQPLLVLADTALMATLPMRERRAGYAEIVKGGLIADPALYAWCEANGARLLAGDEHLLSHAVEAAVRLKAQVVGDDEREEKPGDGRALLNLGHSFGHALEAETGFGDTLLHGEAVAIGLVAAARLSNLMGFCASDVPSRITAHLSDIGLPTRISALSAERLLAHMQQDKKMRDGKLSFVLLRGVGAAFTEREVPKALVEQTLLDLGAV